MPREQEKNAERVFYQAPTAAPRGAARMAAVTNSQILHAISQLIKINEKNWREEIKRVF